MVKADGFRLASTILEIISTCLMIYNYVSPDTTVKTAGLVRDCKENGILNKEGRRYLNRLYGIYNEHNNEEFREENINFVRDETELDLEVILDRRYKTNTLNTTRKKNLTECVASKDNTKDVIGNLAKYVGYN